MSSGTSQFVGEGRAANAEIRTHCPFCAFQCGTVMQIEPSRSVSITPDVEFPVNQGRMCIKGFSAAELLRRGDRITTPLKRKSKNNFVSISWEEALDEIASLMLALQSKYGADSVAAFGSGALTNEKAYLLGKFMRVAVGSANIDYNGRYCMSSAAAGQNKAFGIDRGLPFPVSDIARCATVVLWGANSADTLPPIMQWFEKQQANGGKLIVVDPRRTETAQFASLHLQLTPGTDLALANGILHVAIDENLIDHDYIVARTKGFEDLRRVVRDYHPAHVERLTGVSERSIREATRMLAKSASSMVLSGRGPEQQSKGTDTVLSLINLVLALGKVGRPHSGYGCLTGQGNGQGGREHGQKADQLPGYRRIDVAEHREAVAKVWGIDASSLPGKGKSAYELCDAFGPKGGIRGLLVFGSNLSVASPGSGHIDSRLRDLDLLVVCDSFMNETAQHAGFFLPVTQWAEEEGTMTNLEGRVIRRRKAFDPPACVLSDINILCALAERLGKGQYFRYNSEEEVFNELCRASSGGIADYAGISYERIEREQGVFWPCPSDDHPGTPRLFAEKFHHPDGKARFHPIQHVDAAELPDRDYPIYFTTGRYREHYNSGAQTRKMPTTISRKPEPLLQMHPRLAKQLGVSNGELVRAESRRGAAEFYVQVSNEIRPDTVFAPFHWGGRRAANLLTNPALDPTSRMPEFKVCAVQITSSLQSHL
jgi:assimilatory nitrate reductase catalytic subunit